MLRRWYGIAVGGLGWSPKVFWKATVAEFILAVDGHNETQQAASGKSPPVLRAELEALEAEYLSHEMVA